MLSQTRIEHYKVLYYSLEISLIYYQELHPTKLPLLSKYCVNTFFKMFFASQIKCQYPVAEYFLHSINKYSHLLFVSNHVKELFQTSLNVLSLESYHLRINHGVEELSNAVHSKSSV